MCDPDIVFLKQKFEIEINAKQQEIDILVETHKIQIRAKEDLEIINQKYVKDLKKSYILKINSLEENYQSLIDNKDKQIKVYEDEIEKWKTISSEVANKQIIIKANNINIDQSRTINNSGTVNTSGSGAMNLGDISGTVANTINQLPDSSNLKEPGIKELLAELQEAIKQESELDEKGKVKALKQLKTLAEASLNPTDEDAKEVAEDSTTIMSKVLSGLPPAAALVSISKNILPLIATYFGFDLPLWF